MLLKSIILGLVQGLTEFLPVSSSGHLVLSKNFLDLSTQGVIWEISLHFSTLLAVFGVFHKDIALMIKSVCVSTKKVFCGDKFIDVYRNDFHTRLFVLLIIGTVPTAIIAILFKDQFEQLFGKPVLVGFMLIITGTILWFTKWSCKAGREKKDLGVIRSLLVGAVQGLAITPGISRAGATIAAATFMGVDRETAARFSFLLSIPAILGAMATMVNNPIALGRGELSFLLIGSAAAAISGYISLRLLIKIITIGKLHLFSYYCWTVGLFAVFCFL
ncbi:MAG: undecaprenyl-diphosphate phosphatase [Candidatus Scalindua sp.]|nr:undecaprenyl-diphosphate phosphatase [Candidatus Scalindua sp.]